MMERWGIRDLWQWFGWFCLENGLGWGWRLCSFASFCRVIEGLFLDRKNIKNDKTRNPPLFSVLLLPTPFPYSSPLFRWKYFSMFFYLLIILSSITQWKKVKETVHKIVSPTMIFRAHSVKKSDSSTKLALMSNSCSLLLTEIKNLPQWKITIRKSCLRGSKRNKTIGRWGSSTKRVTFIKRRDRNALLVL